MTDVNANIGINFDTSQALEQLRQLQAGLSRFNQTLTQGNVAAMNAQKGLNAQLVQAINATGKFVATQKDVATSTSSFTSALEKNQLSMRQYFRYTAAAATQNTSVLKGMFAQERETLTRASKDRVKLLQSQYIQMQAANGDMIKVLQVIPKHLRMVNGQYADYATRMQMVAQRQQFLNQLLKQGSTQLLNFGKNTQWAGRQLMVGLTIPLSILGSTAAKTFMDMEVAITKFSRVYGDMLTNQDTTDKAIANIQKLGKEFTKYGIAVKDTITMAADAAAMGLTGDALNAQVIQATRLAVLGQVEQQQALQTTISLSNVFGIASDQLAKKINYLNAVENQTVLSIEDLTVAIPKAGPVVKQLGGSVEDLAFFMTAMKEGGINAAEGANALKSGLASMINPSKKASDMLAGFGINIAGLVNNNAGNLKGTVVGIARALDTLDPLNRARAIEQMFGKFQFARISTLFQNIIKDGSQAGKALDLAGASIEELAILSERELGKVENMTGNKFKKSMENLKLQLVPIGKAFLQAATPIVNFVSRILEKFNTLGDGTKKIIAIIIGVVGGLAPIALMTFGILANGIANIIKFFAMLRGGIAKLNGANNVLGGGFDYLTNQQIENLAETNALHTSHNRLISTFNVEQSSVNALALAYGNAASQARALASSSPGLFNTVPGPAGAVAGLPKKFATGGVVPGTGNKDTVPALLTPGEVVITKDTAKANPELVAALQNGSVKRYHKGTGPHKHNGKSPQEMQALIDSVGERRGVNIADQPTSGAVQGGTFKDATYSIDAMMAPGNTAAGPGMDMKWLAQSEEAGASIVSALKVGQMRIEGATVSQKKYSEFWSDLTPELDEIAGIFQSMAATSKTADEAGKKAYPLIVKRIEEMEASGRISAENAGKLKLRTRSLLDPTPEDRTASRSARYEVAVDPETGQERVKKKSWDARQTQTGPSYDPKPFEAGYKYELKQRGMAEPKNLKGHDFAHVADRLEGEQITKPVTFRQYRSGTGPTPGEAELAKRLESGQPIKTGDVLSSKKDLEAWTKEKLDLEAQDDLANAVDAQITKARKKAKAASPSERTRELGKDIADGLTVGMQDGQSDVQAQSDRLVEAAIPEKPRTAAETQAKVDKMDLGNKAFYDDINTPEFRDQRQILKSQDRHRRKMGATGTVGGGPGTPPVPGPSSLTIASTAKTEAAAKQLAVSTEQAATAQSQVVQQIHDESKSRVTIKGNTINIGKARQEADRLDKEASDAEAAAAKIRSEAAKWEEVAAREKGKNMQTAENAKALKKQADEAEIRAAEARIKAAEAEIVAAQLENGDGATGQIIQDPVKTPAKVKKAEKIMSNGTVEAGDGMRRIVDGTDKTADSTLLVADQTDELAKVTGDALDAQKETATNLLTGSQITDATTGNLNDVLQSTGQIGLAQQDLANSSEGVAKLNNEIEQQKKIERDRLAKMNADAAAQAALNNGIVPPGKQSNGKYINPSTAMGSVEAYDEASTYTKNKKGSLLFDPETGEPTTLTEKQLKQKKRGMRREKVGKFSGKAAGSLGTAAMIAGMAGAPPQVTAALGGAATVAQFAPMLAGLTGPQGIVIGIAALAAGAYLLNKHFNDMAAAAAKFATDLSATRDGLKAIGEMSGKVGSSEIMDKRRQTSQYGKYNESTKIDNTFGNKFMGSEVGKKEKKLFQENVKQFGSEKAIGDLSLKLSTAIADGVLDANAANSIAAELALQLKDQKLEMQVVGQISAMLGPDGKNLKDHPIETRALIMANSNARTTKAETAVAEGNGNTRKNVATIAAYNMNNIQMATMMADQVAMEYENQKKKLETELASTTNAQKKLDIANQIAQLDAQNIADTKAMNAQILSQIALQEKSFKKVFSNSRWGSQANKEDAYFDGTRNQLQTNYNGTDQEQAAKTFLNTTESLSKNTLTNGLQNQQQAQTFQAKWEMLVGSKVLNPTEAQNYIDLFSGKLNELDLFFNASVGINGPQKTKELLNMFAGYKDKKKATAMVTQIALTKTNPGEFDRIMEALRGIASLDGSTIDMEVLVTTLGLEGVEVLKTQMENIEKLKVDAAKKGQKTMDLEQAKAINPAQAAAIDALKQNVERKKQFDALSLEGQAEYLQKLATQFAYEGMMTDKQKQASADAFAYQQAYMQQTALGFAVGSAEFLVAEAKFKAAYLALSTGAQAVAKLSPVGSGGVTSLGAGAATPASGGTKKEDPLAFLDALAMRIKMIRDQSFNAKKPIDSMLAAFTSPAAKKNVADMFKLFDGIQQKLIALKVPQELRDYIAGLTADQYDALNKADLNSKKKGQQGIFEYGTKKDKKGNDIKDKKGNVVYDKTKIIGISAEGKAIIAAYNEAPLDKFNIAQRAIISDTDNQFKAFNKLKAQGIDTNVALETVSDSVLAAAIASSALAGTDLQAFIDDLKKAASAAEKAAVITDLLKKNADFKFKSESVPKLAAALKQTGMSVENIQTVLSDPALAKQLIADLEDGKIDSKAIADYLNSIKDEKIVEIRGKFNAGDFAGAAAPGMELVSKMFTVQEQLIRTGIDKRSTAMVARLKDLKNSNEDAQLLIQQITFAKIRPIEKAIEVATRNLEINVTRKIEAYQEQINNLQRVVEIAFERPIAKINAENTIMSNDMEVMNHSAEEINKRYDEQATALSKIAEIKSQIVEQEKEQLDLADALSKGDIGAAARAIQAIRAAQATRNAENASKALEQSRKNKIDSLTGKESGLTKDQITERQYQNAQAIYDLENKATVDVNGKLMTRLQILNDIQKKNDQIFALEEKRKEAQLAIRDQEDAIYNIKQNQIAPLENIIDTNNLQIATDERAMQKMVDGITVLGKTKDVWDGISAKIDASSLAGADFDRLMGSMLASTDKIDEGWQKITDTLSKYSSESATGVGTAMDLMSTSLKKELALNEKIAKDKADAAKAAQDAALAEYKIKKDAYDLEVQSLKTQLEAAKARNDFYVAGMIQQAIVDKVKKGPPVAPVTGPNTAADNPNANYNDLTQNSATDMYNSAAYKGLTTSNSGGSSSSGGSTTSGGSGTSSTSTAPNLPSPGQKAGNTTPTPVVTTPVASATAIANMKIPFAPTTKTKNAIYSTTDKGLKEKEIQLIYNFNKTIESIRAEYKDANAPAALMGIDYIKSDADFKISVANAVSMVSDKDKSKLREKLDALFKEKKMIDTYSYSTDSTGKLSFAYASDSDAKDNNVAAAKKALPKDIVDILEILKQVNATISADTKQMSLTKSKYKKIKDDSGYQSKDINSWDLETIKTSDPTAYKSILPAYQEYNKLAKDMESKSETASRARYLINKSGYIAKDLGFYFDGGTNYALHHGTSNRYNSSNDYANWKGYATGGLVSSQFAQKNFKMGTDTVPAMLTPGEFVMNKFAVQSHGIGKMQEMNNGSSAGDSVYNYSISVNVKSDSNPDEIAKTVIAQIKSIDAQKIRGVRK